MWNNQNRNNISKDNNNNTNKSSSEIQDPVELLEVSMRRKILPIP